MYMPRKESYQKVNGVLEKYDGAIATAKNDVVCNDGKFSEGSLICIEKELFTISEEEIDVNLKIYDCFEMNELGKEHQPYTTYDKLEIYADDLNDLEKQLSDLFEVDGKKTDCQKDYAEIRQKAINCIIDSDTANQVCSEVSLVALILLVFTAIFHFVVVKEKLSADIGNVIQILKTLEFLFTVVMIICLASSFTVKRVLVHKIHEFKEKADDIHSRITKKSLT